MEKYNFKKIEEKWQDKWEKEKIYQTDTNSKKEKYYCLVEFPYPSGEGLHVGHPRSYTAMDIIARKRRMQGKNVLYPIGWDAFGLPTENYAIKTGIHPREATEKNIKNFKRQLKRLGFSFDWSREINTTDPEYYKWTQWMFLKFFERGLAYKDKMAINWCPSCKIGLANEEVVDGKCERCGGEVAKREKEQWMLKITKYADRLIDDLEKVDYLPQIKEQQKNWIGKSVGAKIKFEIVPKYGYEEKNINLSKNSQHSSTSVEVFTTRPDTLFGATYMVLSPEHPLLKNQESGIRNYEEVKKYIEQASKKSDLERTELQKEKTGVELKGVKAINPATGEEIPIWIADYVLASYGTGAIMAVPAHDARDWEFAQKFGLPVRQVVRRESAAAKSYLMGAEDINDNELKKLGIKIVEKTAKGYRKIEIPQNKLNLYEKLIEKKMTSGFWNEYIGDEIVFIFKFKNGKLERLVLNRDTESRIDQLAAEFMGEEWNKSCVWKWLAQNSWYTDFIIFFGEGININSDFLNGLPTKEAKEKMIEWLREKGLGKRAINYKLRDWVFSRQRYWGEPIPLVYCENCAEKKPKILLIYGFGGNSKENWFPWLKKQMENNSYEVIIPDLPHADKPKLAEWVKALENLGLSKDDKLFVVGHSLGAPAACHFITQSGLPVEKLILVAPAGKSVNWQNLKKYGFSDEDIKNIKNFVETEFNFINLKKLIKETIIYFSEDDPYIPLTVKKDYEGLAGAIRIFKNKKHFNESYGVTELPEILEEFPKVKNLNLGWVPVPEKDLPIKLPEVKKYEPTDSGESPLANVENWVNIKCPKCGGPAKRETDTMPNWAGSSWYFLRYTDPRNNSEFADEKNLKYWMPADWYNGGMEHTTLHLLYSRFWYKFLYDIGEIPKECDDEPYQKRTSHGMILGEGGEKMSKSRGNVINPDDVVAEYGADTFRVYEMFMGPFDQAIPWDTNGLVGCQRFLNKIWSLQSHVVETQNFASLEKVLHKTIKKVTEDIEEMKFNTAISAMMILINEMERQESVSIIHYSKFLILLAPFAPHITEEIWSNLGNKKSIHLESWPTYDPELIKDEEITLVVQINGKVRDNIKVAVDISEEEAGKLALKSEKIKKFVSGKPKKVIFVPGKLINIVV